MSINDDTSPTTVSYGGTVIARLEAGQTANLPCAKKRMKADVKIVAGSGGGSGGGSVGGARKTISASAKAVDVVSAHTSINFSLTTNVEVTQ